MTRRPPRTLTRRLALALSLMLLAAAMTVPAFATTNTAMILSPDESESFGPDGILELRAKAQDGFAGTPQWALRQGSSAAGQGAAFTRAGNVDGFGDDLKFDSTSEEFFIELPIVDLGLSYEDFTVGSNTYTGIDFFFVFNTGSSNRPISEFTISPLGSFAGGEIVDCDPEEPSECSIEAVGDQTYTASTTTPAKGDQTARLGLRIPDSEDAVRQAVFEACQAQLADDQRLGGDVAHLVPVGFAAGSLTVTNFIPRSVIKNGVNRGTDAFQVCVAPTAAEAEGYGDYFDESVVPPHLGETGLVGPFLLDDCGDDPEQTACVESRQRLPGADLLITYRIPAVDPWMM